MGLTVTTDTDPTIDVITVTLSGVLDLTSAPTVRTALLKALARSPEAVVVDLGQVRVERRSRLTVFPAAVRCCADPPVALLLYGASAELTGLMAGGVLGGVPVFPTRAVALAALASAHPVTARRLHVRLAPTPRSAAIARRLIAEVCQDWQLDHLTGPATLITSELVSNAILHAGTDFQLTATVRGSYLHLGVRDGSSRPPRMPPVDVSGQRPLPDHGRGLFLVDIYATAWGSDPSGDGKLVWATLRAVPIGGNRA